MSLLKTAIDKGRFAARQMEWPENPLCQGEVYTYISENDVSRLSQYIAMLVIANGALSDALDRLKP